MVYLPSLLTVALLSINRAQYQLTVLFEASVLTATLSHQCVHLLYVI